MLVSTVYNVMTLDANIHSLFDQLHLWFEAVVSGLQCSECLQDGKENAYNIRVTNEILLLLCKANPIVFKSAHPDLPLPNTAYLRIHAAYCRVAHLSIFIWRGRAGEYLDKRKDLDDNQVLSNDGSSVHILSFALQPYGQEVVVL